MSIPRKITEGAGSGGGSAGGYVDDVFSTYVYAGTDVNRDPNDPAYTQDIENGVDLAGEGGLVWIKRRSGSENHRLYDTERGATQQLTSNDNTAEKVGAGGVQSFNSNGFTDGYYQELGEDYTSWTFRKQPKFFDVVTYVGDQRVGRQIPHNLGVEPGMFIIKCTSDDTDWQVWHRGANGGQARLFLNSAEAMNTASVPYWWGNNQNYIAPTDTHITIGGQVAINGTGREYVAYVFAHDDSEESMIKCGSFTTGAQGKMWNPVDCGFEPQWLLVKNTGASEDWKIYDVMRGLTTTSNAILFPNSTDAEDTGTKLTVTATGFDTPLSNGPFASSANYIYMAIRRPNKPASELEATDVFDVSVLPDGSETNRLPLPFDSDLGISATVNDTSNRLTFARLTGSQHYLRTNGTQAEYDSTVSNAYAFNDVSHSVQNNYQGNGSKVFYNFKRTPGFMDVVCYEGDGQAGREIPHNLGAVPEMMWVKCRSKSDTDTAYGWWVYSSVINRTLVLNQDNAGSSGNNVVWNDAVQDINNLTVGSYKGTNHGLELYIAYLFASVPGICDIGTYEGTGQSGQEVLIPSFTGWVRYLLIKRTDGTGSWWQTADPGGYTSMIKLNTAEAQEKVNAVAPLTGGRGGFQLTTNNAEFNASGGKYIYMAIA